MNEFNKRIGTKVAARIADSGLRMAKLISAGGMFISPTYDTRTVWTLKELYDLTKQGFSIDEDVGLFLFNALMMGIDKDTKDK